MAGCGRVNNPFQITMTRMIALVLDKPLIVLGSNHFYYASREVKQMFTQSIGFLSFRVSSSKFGDQISAVVARIICNDGG